MHAALRRRGQRERSTCDGPNRMLWWWDNDTPSRKRLVTVRHYCNFVEPSCRVRIIWRTTGAGSYKGVRGHVRAVRARDWSRARTARMSSALVRSILAGEFSKAIRYGPFTQLSNRDCSPFVLGDASRSTLPVNCRIAFFLSSFNYRALGQCARARAWSSGFLCFETRADLTTPDLVEQLPLVISVQKH